MPNKKIWSASVTLDLQFPTAQSQLDAMKVAFAAVEAVSALGGGIVVDSFSIDDVGQETIICPEE